MLATLLSAAEVSSPRVSRPDRSATWVAFRSARLRRAVEAPRDRAFISAAVECIGESISPLEGWEFNPEFTEAPLECWRPRLGKKS